MLLDTERKIHGPDIDEEGLLCEIKDNGNVRYQLPDRTLEERNK